MAIVNPTAAGMMAGMAASSALRNKARVNLGNALNEVGQAMVCLEELAKNGGKPTTLAAWTAYGAVKQAMSLLSRVGR